MFEKIVIFDLDGTLHQTHLWALEANKKAAEKLGLKIPGDDEIISLYGETSDQFYKKLLPGLSKAQIEEFRRINEEFEADLMASKAKLYYGIKETLEKLDSADFGIYICSNGSNDYIQTIMAILRINRFIEGFRGNEPGKDKAARVGEIISETGCLFAVMAGDMIYDIEAAHKNDIKAVAVTYGYGKKLGKTADFTADDPFELFDAIVRAYNQFLYGNVSVVSGA